MKMKFGKFLSSLFLVCGTSYNLVKGQQYEQEENDCDILYNFNEDSNDCCLNPGIECDDEGYITSLKM